MKENQEKKDATTKGWKPDVPSAEDALTDDERSLDIGESGQFAPRGYYNQHGVSNPKQTTRKWDDEITPPSRH